MGSELYTLGTANILSGATTFASASYKVALLDAGFSFSIGQQVFSDVSAHEVSGTGYTGGGQALSGQAVSAAVPANSWGTAWGASTNYLPGQIVRPTAGNGYLFRCIANGTSGGSEPSWPTTVGATVFDGTTEWLCVGIFAVTFSATNPAWTSSTISANWAVIYEVGTGDLLWLGDFGSTISSSAGTFTITFDSTSGIFTLVFGQ